jgi:hypothetical protein
LALDDGEIALDGALDVPHLVEEVLARGGDLLVGLLHGRVVLALALGDELAALARGELEGAAQLREVAVRQELGGGHPFGVVGVDRAQLGDARRELLPARAGARQRLLVIRHFHADHLADLLERRAGQLVAALELVELVLVRLELDLEVVELPAEPHHGLGRGDRGLLEVLSDVGARDGLRELARHARARVLDTQRDHVAADERIHLHAGPQHEHRLLGGDGLGRRRLQELGVGRQVEVADHHGEDLVARHDEVLRIVVLRRVDEHVALEPRGLLRGERAHGLRVELDGGDRLVDRRHGLRRRHRDARAEERGRDEDGPRLEHGAKHARRGLAVGPALASGGLLLVLFHLESPLIGRSRPERQL